MEGNPKALYDYLKSKDPKFVNMEEGQFIDFAKSQKNMEGLYDALAQRESIKKYINVDKETFVNSFGNFEASGGSVANNDKIGDKNQPQVNNNQNFIENAPQQSDDNYFSPSNMGIENPYQSETHIGVSSKERIKKSADQQLNYSGKPLSKEAALAEKNFGIDTEKYKDRQPYFHETQDYKDLSTLSKKELEKLYQSHIYSLDHIPENQTEERKPIEKQLDRLVDFMGNKTNPDRFGVINTEEEIANSLARGNDWASSYEDTRNKADVNLKGIESSINDLKGKLNKDLNIPEGYDAYALWEQLGR